MPKPTPHLPIYQQLRATVIERILVGHLAPGDAVPSVRQVAATERVSPLTVSKAYQLLVAEGLLNKRRGLGMFVSPDAQRRALAQERKRFLQHEWPAVLRRLQALELELQQLPS